MLFVFNLQDRSVGVELQIGVLVYVAAILHFLTLPVEFDASKRALKQIDDLHLVTDVEHEGAKEVLKAAAMTYVSGVASSTGYLVYLLFVGGRALLGRPGLPPAPPVGWLRVLPQPLVRFEDPSP